MIATISIVVHNRIDITRECLTWLKRNTPSEGVEYIISDNASTDGSYEFLNNFPLLNKRVIPYQENYGFPLPHNEALRIANGKFFIVLNNDIFIKSENWLMNLLDPLTKDETVALVGFEGNPCSLSDQAKGVLGQTLEYIEGSCIAGRTEFFVKYGLFSPAYELAYYEDADLSLRVRQMGLQIRQTKVVFEHHRGSTANHVKKDKLINAQKKNREVFLGRWRGYIANRRFSNRVLVRSVSDGIGDVIATTPIVEGIRRDHPTAHIALETTYPDVFKNSPYVDEITNGTKQHSIAFDRVIDIMPSGKSPRPFNFASYRTFCEEAERGACTKVFNRAPQLFLTRDELEVGARLVRELRDEAKPLVVFSTTSIHRKFWQGKSWPIENMIEAINILNDLGYITVELGKGIPETNAATYNLVGKLSLRELFGFLANLSGIDVQTGKNKIQHISDYLVTIDSLPLWVAQAFSIPTLCLFGATEPLSRVIAYDSTYIIRNEGMDCLGCYQKKGQPTYNRCQFGHEECMSGIPGSYIAACVHGEIDTRSLNMSYLYNFARRRVGI